MHKSWSTAANEAGLQASAEGTFRLKCCLERCAVDRPQDGLSRGFAQGSNTGFAAGTDRYLQAVGAVEDGEEVLADLQVVQLHIFAVLQQHLQSHHVPDLDDRGSSLGPKLSLSGALLLYPAIGLKLTAVHSIAQTCQQPFWQCSRVPGAQLRCAMAANVKCVGMDTC